MTPPVQALEWDADSFSSWAECHFATTPEKKLLVAIIQRAILDYLGRPEKWRRRAQKLQIRNLRAAAFEYLYSPDISRWSFRWICDQLSDDGDEMRLLILEGVTKLNNPSFSGLRSHCVHYRNLFGEHYGKRVRRKKCLANSSYSAKLAQYEQKECKNTPKAARKRSKRRKTR